LEYITAFRETGCLSNSNEQKSVVDEEENREEEQVSETVQEMESTSNSGLVKALDTYRKLIEGKEGFRLQRHKEDKQMKQQKKLVQNQRKKREIRER